MTGGGKIDGCWPESGDGEFGVVGFWGFIDCWVGIEKANRIGDRGGHKK